MDGLVAILVEQREVIYCYLVEWEGFRLRTGPEYVLSGVPDVRNTHPAFLNPDEPSQIPSPLIPNPVRFRSQSDS